MALEANPEVPKMAVVVERLLHIKRKMKEKENPVKDERAMNVKTPRRKVKCHYCKRFGHYKQDCWDQERVTRMRSIKPLLLWRRQVTQRVIVKL